MTWRNQPLAILSATVLSVLCIVAGYFINHPLVFVALPVAIPAVLVVFRFPFWVCLTFILFSFFRIHEAFPGLIPLRIPQLLAIGSFTVLGWHLFMTGSIKVYWSRNLTIFCLFFCLICLGALLATDRARSIAMITGSFSKIAVMVFAIAWLTRRDKDFEIAGWAFVLAGSLIAGVAVFNKLNGIGLVEETRVTIGRNIGSMIGDPNDLALVLTFPLGFAISLFATTGFKPWQRLIALMACGLIVWGILATQSRGGLLGLLVVSGIVAWRKVDNKAWLILAGSLGLTILVGLAGISDRASGGAGEDGIDESAMGRLYAWGAAWRMGLSYPFTGVGIDNFYVNYYFYSEHWDGKNHAVHSTWLQVFAESGVLGFLVFIVLVGAIFRSVLGSLKRLDKELQSSRGLHMIAQALLAGLCGFCISGTFLTQGFIWPLYILLALSVALQKNLESQGTGTVPAESLIAKPMARSMGSAPD